MSYEKYAAIDAVNVSTLLELRKSPLHYRYAVDNGTKDSPALRFGRLAHLAILEPDVYAATVAVFDGDKRTKAWKEFQVANEGKTITSEAEHELCMALSTSIREHSVAGKYLARGGASEVTMQWDVRPGLKAKGRLDWYDAGSNLVIDIKTAMSADPIDFGRAAARHAYEVRAAWYMDGARAAFGVTPEFVFVAIEKHPPYAVACYRMTEEATESGRKQYQSLLDKLEQCRTSGEWPGYGADQETELMLPAWAYAPDDELELVIDGEAVGL